MMANRLGGVVQQAVNTAVHATRQASGGGEAAPAGLASAFLRCLEAQLEGRRYMSAGDEAGDVLGSFPSATLLYYPGGGLQGVLEHVAAAAAAARGPAGPAAVGLLRSLAGAVGRVASAPNAEAARPKAAAVMTCLFGLAEALEGATKREATDPKAPHATGARGGHQEAAAEAGAEAKAVDSKAAQLLWEAAVVVDNIAAGAFSSHTGPSGHTISTSAPTHPLLSVLETRLYAEATWRPDSPAHIAAGLVELLADRLAPPAAGSSLTDAGAAPRGAACNVLHHMARAQAGLGATLKAHGAAPAAASRLLASLAEALAAAVLTRDAAEPATSGPAPGRLFGEASLLLGLSRMAAGEALARAGEDEATARASTAAAVAAEAAAGDSTVDAQAGCSDASLVLEVLAEQAAGVAARHKEHIAQVFQDLREVPRGLGALSGLPYDSAAAAGMLLVRQAGADAAKRAAAEAADAVAAANEAAARPAEEREKGDVGTAAQQQQ